MQRPFDNWEERVKNLPTVRFEAVDETAPTVRIDLKDKTVRFTITPDDASPGQGSRAAIENNYQRYMDFEELGIGGTGVVNSCLDPHLNRRVAVKVLRYEHGSDQEQRTRFVREARVMAQLEHPNILPIHELGIRPDNTIYYSMKKVDGRTLQEVIDGLSAEKEAFINAYPLEQMLDTFLHICHAMAFAHSRGVIHRDLKPENVLIGPFGEVLVMDWGLAKLIGEEEFHVSRQSLKELDRQLNVRCGTTTMDGDIAGTPVYMSPEQATGKSSEMDQRTDIYSLGVILYEILTLHRPIDGDSIAEILKRVAEGKINPPRRAGSKRYIPAELDAICMKALATNPSDRYPDLKHFIADLENYEAGHPVSVFQDSVLRQGWKWCKRHPILSSTSAASLLALVITLGTLGLIWHVRRTDFLEAGDREMVDAVAVQKELLVNVQVLDAVQQGTTEKSISKEEERQLAKVDTLEAELMGHLRNAEYLFTKARLRVKGKVPDRIVTINRLRVEYLIAKKDYAKLAHHMNYLRENLLPLLDENHPDKQTVSRLMSIAEGRGALSIKTQPANQFVALWKYQLDNSGVLKPVFLRSLGTAPIESLEVDKGSYLLVASATNPEFDNTSTLPRQPDIGTTYYPVMIDHAEIETLTVTKVEAVPDGMIYVPAGKTYLGGLHSPHLRLHETSIEAFFIKQHEVTFSEYLEFWQSPDGGNRSPQNMARVRFSRDTYRYDDAWDANGTLLPQLQLDRPIVGINYSCAVAYCNWLAKKLGREVRLPTAAEWEKAARGVDARPMVWGESKDPGLCFTLGNVDAHTKYGTWAPPGSFYHDTSVYGVQDMAGNVREWTSSQFKESPYFQIKGGSSSLTQRFTYCSYASDTPVVPSDVGFRYVMP